MLKIGVEKIEKVFFWKDPTVLHGGYCLFFSSPRSKGFDHLPFLSHGFGDDFFD